MARILSIALNPTIDVSCVAEYVQPTKKTRTNDQKLDPGGGGINVARVIQALGGKCELLYLCGGKTGVILEAFLEELEAVKHRIDISEDIRVALTVHEEATSFDFRFVPEGPVVSDQEFEQTLPVLEGFDGDYIVASGSLPRGIDENSYSRMADIAARNGTRFILDTSGPALGNVLKTSSVFLAKPSLEELEELVGHALDEQAASDAALDLVRRGAAANVAVSMGAEGAFLANQDGIYRMPAKHVVARSAVGAGDSFVAGMTHALSGGKSTQEAFRFGMAAGTAAVMTPATELCHREDVDKIYEMLSGKKFGPGIV